MLKAIHRSASKYVRPLKRLWISRSNARTFTEVYEKRFWGTSDNSDPYYSGVGSYDPCVPEYVELVKSVISSLEIRLVTEIGCGDFAVARQNIGSCDSYMGIDVVKGLIERNTRLFGSERVRFKCVDATKQKLDPSDLCIVRQVLQHLSNKDILKILSNQRSKHLLITEHLPSPENVVAINLDKMSGGDIRAQFGSGVFIDHPPFNLRATVLLERQIAADGSRLVTWLVAFTH
jgi:hypothetical protein